MQEVDAAEVQAGNHGAGTVVGKREAHGVKRRELHPAGVVGVESGGTNDRTESGEVQLERRVGVKGRRVGQLGRRDPLGDQLLGE